MKQVLIANYGLGNVKSVLRAFEHIGVSCNLSKNPKEICDADYLVLPGVGAFKNGMEGLASAGFIDSIFELVLKERP